MRALCPLVLLVGFNCADAGSHERSGQARSAILAVGAPFEVDSPVYGASADYPQFPSIASSGSGRLVVWSSLAGGIRSIYARRWATDGTFPEVSPITVAELGANQSQPLVASDGSDFLIAWADTGAQEVLAARVANDGTLLDAAPLVVGQYSGVTARHQLVYGAGQYYLTWNSGPGASIRGARVTPSGTVLDPGGTLLDPSLTCGGGVTRLASNDQSYLVACGTYSQVDQDDIHGVRIDPSSNTALDAPPLMLAGGLGYQSVRGLGAAGDTYVMSYVASASTTYATRAIAADGQLSPPLLTPNLVSSTLPFDGQHLWFVGPLVASQATAKRAGPTGVPIDSSPISIGYAGGGSNRTHAAADLTGELAFVWEREDNNVFRVFGARALADGSVVDAGGIHIPTAPELYANNQSHSAHAYGGQMHLVVWEDDRVPGQTGIYGARVSSSGQTLDPNALPIAISGDNGEPAVAWNGTDFVVVYTSESPSGFRVVRAARVATDGQVTPEVHMWAANSGLHAEHPALVWGNGQYLLAFEMDSVSSCGDVRALLMDPSFAIVGTALNEEGNQPVVSFGGSDFMVAWQVECLSPNDPLLAEVMTSSGTPLGPVTLATAARKPSIASDGSQYVISWTEALTNNLNASRISVSGFPIGSAIPIAPNTDIYGSSIVFDGSNFLVAWRQVGSDILAAQLSPAGQLIDATPFAIASSAAAETEPALSMGDGQILATLTFQDSTALYNADRIRGRFLSDQGNGGAGGSGGSGNGGAGEAGGSGSGGGNGGDGGNGGGGTQSSATASTTSATTVTSAAATSGTGPGTGGGAPTDDGGSDSTDDGCSGGCNAGGSGASSPGLIILALLLALRRRGT